MTNVFKSQFGQGMQTVRSFLQRPISVQRGNLTLGVPANDLRDQVRDEQRRRVRRMRRDLYELMQQHPTSRELMRHLDLVERTLRRDGYAAVEALPLRVITKGLAQLERLVWDWSPVGLAELRSRLAVIVRDRRSEAEQHAEREAATTAAAELDMATHPSASTATHVTEVDHAMYEETERSWAGRHPAETSAEISAEISAEMPMAVAIDVANVGSASAHAKR